MSSLSGWNPPRTELNARLKESAARYAALTPLEKAIHDLKQKRSMARGLSKMSTPTEQIDAALDRLPEYVVLTALARYGRHAENCPGASACDCGWKSVEMALLA